MAFRILSSLVLTLFISLTAYAEDIQLNPAHPNQYTVVKGDTLWDISGKFLNHPWQWPLLWQQNQQIQNPHLIYPGDTLYFAVVNGQPQLSLSSNNTPETSAAPASDSTCILSADDIKNGRTEFAISKDGKVLPCIRQTLIKQAVEFIPNTAIARYLGSPKVVAEHELEQASYVIDIAGEHLIAGAGDRVYVRKVTSASPQLYTIYRPGSTYHNPETNEVLGYEAEFIAETQLQQTGDPATLIVTKSAREILKGDRIMPKTDEEFVLSYFPRPPEKPIQGNIISVLGGVSQIGIYDVVVIDKGKREGMKVGHELTIYQKGETVADPFSPQKDEFIKLPDETAGKLMVFRPFERVSYALVMNTTRAIHILDTVKTP